MQKEFYNINDLQLILKQENPPSIFLVTGNSSYVLSGAKRHLDQLLKKYKIVHFNNFKPNPIVEEVRAGMALLKKNRCDLILAIGGGSVLDMAKSINIFSAQDGDADVERYAKRELPLLNPGLPLIAVPTTAGTGSEATHFAVLYIGKTKYSVAHASMLPKYALLDANLTINLPARIAASTGMDALAQAMEAFWSIHSTEQSKQYSREALGLILRYLITAVKKPTADSRMAMMKAANLAGKAINIAKTTASHAVSYPITSYFNVPHGQAVALTLGEMLEYNSEVKTNDCSDPRGVNYVKNTLQEMILMLGANTAEQAKNKISRLMAAIGLEKQLSQLSIIAEEHLEIIIKHGFNPERVKNNPRIITEDSLRIILHKIR